MERLQEDKIPKGEKMLKTEKKADRKIKKGRHT